MELLNVKSIMTATSATFPTGLICQFAIATVSRTCFDTSHLVQRQYFSALQSNLLRGGRFAPSAFALHKGTFTFTAARKPRRFRMHRAHSLAHYSSHSYVIK